MFLFEMMKTEKRVHVVASGHVASAATFILLMADTYELSPFTVLLFHSASCGTVGKIQDITDEASYLHKNQEQLLRFHYKHFFTEEEIDDIIYNKREWFMDMEEFHERYERRNGLEAEERLEIEEQERAELLKELKGAKKEDIIKRIYGGS